MKTRLENAALIAEVLGGVAVVVSVAYLAVQISDNNRLLQSQSHLGALELTHRPFELLISDKSLAAEIDECNRDPFAVDDTTWSRCVNYYFIQANGWEYSYLQLQEEAIPESLWIGLDGYMDNQARTNPGWVRFWEETELGFGEPMRSYIDVRVRQNPAYRSDD